MITLVTKDANQLKEVREYLGVADLRSQDVDTPLEVQSYAKTVANKAKMASLLAGGTVIVEITGLSFEAFGNELPGLEVNRYLEQLGPDGLVRMLEGFDNKRAVAACSVALCESIGSNSMVFHGRVRGRIVAPRGPQTPGWDCIFEPEGSNKTYAEMDKSEKNKFGHRARAYGALKEFLNSS